MAEEVRLEIWEKLELHVDEEDRINKYTCRVQDINDEGIVVSTPTLESVAIALEKGARITAWFTRQDASYMFDTRALASRKDPIPVMVIERPRRIRRRQRREYFRVEVSLPVSYKLTSEDSEVFEGTIVDISAGGVRISTDQPVPEEARLFLSFELPGNRLLDGILSRVVEVVEQSKGEFFLRVMFLEISEAQRNDILNYNVAQQRMLIRKILSDREAYELGLTEATSSR